MADGKVQQSTTKGAEPHEKVTVKVAISDSTLTFSLGRGLVPVSFSISKVPTDVPLYPVVGLGNMDTSVTLLAAEEGEDDENGTANKKEAAPGVTQKVSHQEQQLLYNPEDYEDLKVKLSPWRWIHCTHVPAQPEGLPWRGCSCYLHQCMLCRDVSFSTFDRVFGVSR